MQKYEELLQHFADISQCHISEKTLEKLKEKYKNDIYSKRVLKDIVDINYLLRVLTKRGVLQYNDVTALKDITDEYIINESIKQQIRNLITDYNLWLNENSGTINLLYNSGKSNVLLNSNELNISQSLSQISASIYLRNNSDTNLQTSTEDTTKESLHSNKSLNTVNLPENEKDNNKNIFFIINSKICPLNINKKKVSTIFIIYVLMFIISILIVIVWILIKLPHNMSAFVTVLSSTQATLGQSQANMTNHMPNTASYSTESMFFVNHTRIYTSTVPPVVKEKELQNIVTRELSKKIGIFWKDVCRSLDMDENIIDEITMEYSREPFGHKYEKMFKKGLQLYFSEPRRNWKIDLTRALRISKRVDLQNKVEEIIQNYSTP